MSLPEVPEVQRYPLWKDVSVAALCEGRENTIGLHWDIKEAKTLENKD